MRRLERNLDGLVSHTGLAWRRWQVAIAAGAGLVLLDDSAVSVNTQDDAG